MKRFVAILLLLAASSAALARPRRKPAPLSLATLDTRAEETLFTRSDPVKAQAVAAAALARNATDRRALFVSMEAAALQADHDATLASAIRLADGNDLLARIAAARIADLAADRPEFLRHLAALRQLISARVPASARLAEALVNAAADGAPGISLPEAAAQAGLLTRWRISPALGNHPYVDFDRAFAPERDGLSSPAYDGSQPENFCFPDGLVQLPEYLPRTGVFYAAADFDVASSAQRLQLQSPGTAEIFIDGVPALHHDDRFELMPVRAAAPLALAPGRHRLLVKFLASAAPFRVSIGPGISTVSATPRLSASAADYAAAADHFWSGDLAAALAVTESRAASPFSLLRALALHRLSPSDPEVPGTLQRALDASPAAAAALLELADARLAAGRYDTAAESLAKAAGLRSASPRTQELLYRLALHDGDDPAADAALRSRLALHPDCGAWRDAVDFYSRRRDFAAADSATRNLRGCAPGSLAFAGVLAAAGQHAQAAGAALGLVHENPLDRAALSFAVEELVLAGEPGEARDLAQDLASLAPNSRRFNLWARQLQSPSPPLILDNEPVAQSDSAAFYLPYRRDALALATRARDRRFVGGLAVQLLNDRVAHVNSDGSAALYVHQLVRVLNRSGVERYGEVALPEGADLLQLRTIQPDGRTAEPEFTANKRTVSMPALAAESVIEQEYVLRFRDSDALRAHPDAFRYTFGSFDAPVLFSRFVAITPLAVPALAAGNVPPPVEQESNGGLTRIWERDDLPQPAREVAMPSAGLLPYLQLAAPGERTWDEVRDRYRDVLLAASQIGPRVRASAARLDGTDREKLQQAYARLLSRVQRDGSSFDQGNLKPAEATLSSGEGSRTAAMVAIAAAEGWRPEVLLARHLDRSPPVAVDGAAYQRPLVRLWISDGSATRPVLLDMETDGLTFGGIPGELARADALVVPLAPPASASLFAALAGAVPDENHAEARLSLDSDGTLAAHLTITMGPSRAAQMRSILRGIRRADRQHFFDQLALRIFPGAADVTGEVLREDNVLQPLAIELSCRARHFADISGSAAPLAQVAPALGLRRMYAAGDTRRFPLYLDSSLFETATFRLALPPGMRLLAGADDVRLDSLFGSYHAAFRETAPGQVEILRAFHLDPQLIPPDRYLEFSAFARQIENVERRRLTIGAASLISRVR